MPKQRPFDRRSEVVKVVFDEMMTALLHYVPEPDLAKVIAVAHLRAEKRLKKSTLKNRPRDGVYNARVCFQQMALRLTNAPDKLHTILGIKDGKQPDLPDMETTDGTPTLPRTKEEDEFALCLKIPTFDEYSSAFDRWPYVQDTMDGGEHVLVLGYASFRDKDTDDLVYRNCAYYGPDDDVTSKGTVFKELASLTGVLKKNSGNVRQFLKVLPYKPGARIRFWTNVRGEKGDRPHLTRYVVLGTDGIRQVATRAQMDDWPRDGKPPLTWGNEGDRRGQMVSSG